MKHAFGPCALAACALALPAPAYAEDNGPYGALLVFAVAGGTALGGLPLLLGRSGTAPLFIDVDLGAGGRLDSFAIGADLEGTFGKDSPWGWAARAQADLLVDDGTQESSLLVTNQRFDVLGTLVLLGRAMGPLSLEALAGVTVWPSFDDRDADAETEPYAALGPSTSLRAQANTSLFRGSVEAGYLPLFFEAPTRLHHHLELTSEIGISPWDSMAITAGFKRLIGFGGEELYKGTEITLGLRMNVNELQQQP